MNIRNPSKKVKTAVFLAVVYFLMLRRYINEPFFTADEGEIFMKGTAVANGRLLYRDVTSQHMPVMYYIAAVFSLLGVSTIPAFRLCFYALMVLLWVAMYWRYGEKIGQKSVGLYPVVYIILLKYIDMGHAVLSEQFQGLGMVILFFELLIFEKERELKRGNMVMISLAVFLSFGSAFVSIFAIFFVVLTVICLELYRYWEMKLGLKDAVCKLFQSYWKLIVYTVAPFIVLILYYVITGTLDDFYDWAYVINRTVYPKYNGYGISILDTMFAGFSQILPSASLPTAAWTSEQQAFFVLTSGAISYLVYLQRQRKNWILVLGIVLIWVGTGTRGYITFHGTPAVAMACAMFTLAMDAAMCRWENNTPAVCAMVLVMVSVASSYILLALNFSPAQTIASFKIDPESGSYIVDLLTEDKEVVGYSAMQMNYLFESGTSPSMVSAACPWFWEFKGEEALQKYIEDPPRVFIYDPTLTTWGYPIVDYAKPLDSFIHKNYTNLDEMGYSTIYIRNDCYEAACAIINQDSIQRTGYPKPKFSYDLDATTNTVQLLLTDAPQYQGVSFYVWSSQNWQDDLKHYDAQNLAGDGWRCTVDLNNHSDEGLYYVHVYITDDGESKFLKQRTFTR